MFFEKDAGQCANVSQTKHSGDSPDTDIFVPKTRMAEGIDPNYSGALSGLSESEEEMDMTGLSQSMADQPQVPPNLVLKTTECCTF